MSNSILILPDYSQPDTRGDGGIRRVVEAQNRWLADMGWNIVKDALDADVIALHAMILKTPPKREQVLVSHNHGLYWQEYEWPDLYYDINLDVVESMRRADAVTAPSAWVAKALQRGMWLNPTVIHHGIDTDNPMFVEPSSGSGGYVLWNKARWDNVSDPTAMMELASRARDVPFVSTFGVLAPNVTITGAVGYDLSLKFVHEAAVYLCTSQETFGIGTLEAMAAGVPVLGWRYGGHAEFVEQGVTGWLSRPGDYDDLLEGLRYCLANRSRMGLAAREFVFREHDWRNVMRRYHDLYVSHIGSPGRLSPRVSVITTCYALERFLPEAIKSLQEQRMQDWEMIIVDDCSPGDTSGTTAEGLVGLLGDSRIRVVKTPTNLYQAGALNYGCSLAKAKYLFCMDADNEIGYEGALGLLADTLDTHRELDIVYGSLEFAEFDSEDRRVGEWRTSQWPPTNYSYKGQMRGDNQVPSQCLWRKQVFDTVGGYRRRWKAVEDADLWCRAASLGFRAAKVGDFITLRYKMRGNSISNTTRQLKQNWWAWYPPIDSEAHPWAAVADETDRKQLMKHISSCEPVQISVVIPCGPGHEQYVIDAIDSVGNQTFVKWEIIVVNDTGKPWETFVPPFVKVVGSGKGSSAYKKLGVVNPQAHARNVGIAAMASTAFLFVLLDADDYLAPTFMERTLEIYRKFGGFVYTDWIKKEDYEVHESNDWDPERFLAGQFCAITCLFPRAAWVAAGGFDSQLDSWEDWDFFLKLIRAGYCGTRVPEPLFYYRLSTGTVRESLLARKDETFPRILDRHKPFFEGKGKNVACGCGGNGFIPPYVMVPQSQQILEQVPDDQMVLLEFVSNNAAVSYRGPSTGTVYRFGNDSGHKQHWVHKKDAEHFLRLDDFTLIEAGVAGAAPTGAPVSELAMVGGG